MTNAGNREQARSHLGLCLWLGGCLLAAGFAIWHVAAVNRYLDRVTATRFTAEARPTPLQRVPQAIAPDGQVWVRHTLAQAESGRWRLRMSEIDNAPEGRAIYWNSGWALWLEACGRARAAWTGQPLVAAVEEASAWANLPVFLAVLVLASGWVARRWGGAAGALLALGLAGHRGFYGGFYPAYADHHGLINACGLGVVLGAVMAGAGAWRRGQGAGAAGLPESEVAVMRAMTVSAVCGALGLWVSAASLVVTIACTGVAGLVAGWRPAGADVMVVPAAWRRWGRCGAALSAGFYLLENFPDRLGLRLEANHPLYALAWWGAGESIAAILTWRAEAKPGRWLANRLAGWGALVLIAPAVMLAGGARVFALLDPFLGRIHRSIHEFQPWLTELDRAGWAAYRDQLWILAGVLALAVVWRLQKPVPAERGVVLLAGGVALAAVGLGVGQSRWLLTAGAPVVVLAVWLSAGVCARWHGWRAVVVRTGLVCVFAVGPWTLAAERLKVEKVRDVQLGETVQLLYRDIAGALNAAGADGRAVLLSDPNASVGVAYYGAMRAVGTLYWENRDGLLAAAEILTAHDDAEAAARVYARGITHVALVSSYDFQAEYNYALNGGTGPVTDEQSLGHRLLYRRDVPVWLRPLDYRVPAPLTPLGFKVALFAVDFETPQSVAHERIGLYQLAQGERARAEASFMAALKADATRPEPWLRLGELAAADGRREAAVNLLRAGIERAPAGERARLRQSAAALLGAPVE